MIILVIEVFLKKVSLHIVELYHQKILLVIKLSPGKAYVRGYEIEVPTSPVFLDCPKTKNNKTLENQNIIYNTGATLKLNRAYGSPTIGIGNTYI